MLGTIRAFVNINWRLTTNKHGYFVGSRNCPTLSGAGQLTTQLAQRHSSDGQVLLGQFGSEHIYMLNLRGFCEQLRGIGHQRRRDRTRQMCRASGFVSESIENTES